MKKTTALFISGILASAVPASGFLIAGWDTWDDSPHGAGSDTYSASVVNGVTATAVGTDKDGIGWGPWANTTFNNGASGDGTWGTVVGEVSASSATDDPTAATGLRNSTGSGELTITITNTSESAMELESFHFDAAETREKAPGDWTLSILAGSAVTEGEVTSGVLPIQLPMEAGGFDIDLTGLADGTFAPGQTVTFELAFSGGEGDGTGGQNTMVDNLAIMTAERPTIGDDHRIAYARDNIGSATSQQPEYIPGSSNQVGGAGNSEDRFVDNAIVGFDLPTLGSLSDVEGAEFAVTLTGKAIVNSSIPDRNFNTDLYVFNAGITPSQLPPADVLWNTDGLDERGNVSVVMTGLATPDTENGTRLTASLTPAELEAFYNEDGTPRQEAIWFRMNLDDRSTITTRYEYDLDGAEFTMQYPVAELQPHPRVWITPEDRDDLIAKINNEEWAGALFDQMRRRIESVVEDHQEDRDAFIRKLPLDWSGGTTTHPPFRYIEDGEEDDRWIIMNYLQEAIECGIVYFVTEEEKYAQTAADVMATVVSALARMERSPNAGNGGLVYQNNHLKEARIFGAQIPVACDFIYPFVRNGAKVFDVVTGTERDFPFADAQKVFKTYADMAIESGHSGNNWAVLESPSLVQNTLMLDSQEEIEEYLPYYLNKNTARQDPLSVVAQKFAKPGDIWPESFQYSLSVSEITIKLMALLDRWDPDLNLGETYPNIVASAGRLHDIRFPNEDVPALGDGRRNHAPPFDTMEVAYYLASKAGDTETKIRYGSLLKTAEAEDKYSRSSLPGRSLSPHPYFTPLTLLWGAPELEGQEQEYPRSRTAELPFAGLFAQRNLSTSDNPRQDSLMLVVSGASYVHSNASGMALELYGLGEVIGSSGGVGTYLTDIHENYYRLFASHNTVVSNGASATSGPWVNLGMESVQMESMEPLPGEEAVSPHHSFSTTSFYDRHNLVRPADHLRTLALIRTSPTSGYYVDIFRARSDHPDEFHDYIYRNVGETFEFVETPSGFQMEPTPERFQDSADLPWSVNSRYRHPGWHFFTEVSTASAVDGPVLGKFTMESLIPRTIEEIIAGKEVTASMDVHMTGGDNRSYSKALSPPSINAPGIQTELHTMVVRQNGDAWTDPFVSVFESYVDQDQGPSIQSVEKLMEAGEFKGLVVESMVEGKPIQQYVLNIGEGEAPYHNAALDLTFTGHFAVLTTDAAGELVSIYIGDGDSLQYQDTILEADPQTGAAFFTTAAQWMEYGNGMGRLEYSQYPYVYSEKLEGWLYHPHDGLQANQDSWFYVHNYSDLMNQTESSQYPYVYSETLGCWLYHPYDGLQENKDSWFYIYEPRQ